MNLFVAMDEEEKLLYGLFLNSGVRDAEIGKMIGNGSQWVVTYGK